MTRKPRNLWKACKHVPGEPRLSLPTPVNDRAPKVLATAMERSKKIVLSPKRFRSFCARRGFKLPQEQVLETLGLVTQLNFSRCDVITQRVGAPYPDGRYVAGLGIKGTARLCGISLAQAKRRLHLGEQLGMWTGKRGREAYDDDDPDEAPRRCKCCKKGQHIRGKRRYASYNCVYRFTEEFIGWLGLANQWAREKVKALERAGEQRRLEALSNVVYLQFERQRQAMAAKSARFQAEFAADQVERLTRIEREELARIMRKLQLEHPDWGIGRVELEARRRL